MMPAVKIPKRAVYKPAEVCSIADIQPYVLSSWEVDFPDLGVSKEGGRTRLYRPADLDKVLRIKELVFVEGLTLGAAKRKLLKETPESDETTATSFDELVGADAKASLEEVKQGLRDILGLLAGSEEEAAATEASTKGGQAAAPIPTPASPREIRARRKPTIAGKKRVSGKTKTRKPQTA